MTDKLVSQTTAGDREWAAWRAGWVAHSQGACFSANPFALDGVKVTTTPPEPPPIPMRLRCPGCGELHIDAGVFATKPHHTHACQGCGEAWRPAVVCTVGVQFLPGFRNVLSAVELEP